MQFLLNLLIVFFFFLELQKIKIIKRTLSSFLLYVQFFFFDVAENSDVSVFCQWF